MKASRIARVNEDERTASTVLFFFAKESQKSSSPQRESFLTTGWLNAHYPALFLTLFDKLLKVDEPVNNVPNNIQEIPGGLVNATAAPLLTGSFS